MHNVLCKHANKLIKSKCIHLCACGLFIHRTHFLTLHHQLLSKANLEHAFIYMSVGHSKTMEIEISDTHLSGIPDDEVGRWLLSTHSADVFCH